MSELPDIAFRIIDVRDHTHSTGHGTPVFLEAALQQDDGSFKVVFTGDYDYEHVFAAIIGITRDHYQGKLETELARR